MFHRNLSFWSVAVLTASLSWAAPGKGPEGHGRGPDMGRFVTYLEKELALTPTQTAQVRELLKPDSLIGPPPHMGFEGGLPLAGEFVDQLRSPTVDTAALNRQFEQRTAQQRERFARAQFKFTQLHGVLTLEQRHKLADILQKRLDRAEARHEKKKDAKKK